MNYKPTHVLCNNQPVTFADLNPKLEQMKTETLSGGWWQTITLTQRLLEQQENVLKICADLNNVAAQQLRRPGPTYKATYVGPLTAWYGKTALLMDVTLAQFDDMGHYMAHGWHGVRKSDFRVEPKAKLYEALAMMCDARTNCHELGNTDWFETWTERAEALVKEHMPSGSGFDSGTTLDLDESSGAKLVFNTSFHHMDQHGGYDGWTEHQVIVSPSLTHGFTIRVSGRNKNEIKDHISESFGAALNLEVNRYGA